MKQKAIVAIDLGATHTRVALVSEEGMILKKNVTKTKVNGCSGSAVTEDIINTILHSITLSGMKQVRGIGISSAGPLDIARGRVLNSPNIPYACIDLVEPLEEQFGVPATLINDCQAGVIGEQRSGSGQGHENLVYITMSTGIGGGAIVDNRLLTGSGGNAGEIGHFIVDTTYNLPCHCGGTGHWEAYASGRNIPRFFSAWAQEQNIKDDIPGADRSEGIFESAGNNNPVTMAFMEQLGRINARGISNTIVAYSPDIIILDGPLIQHHHELIISPMMDKIERYLPVPEIAVSKLGGNAPLLGAACYCMDSVF